jgi:hypothetical protein
VSYVDTIRNGIQDKLEDAEGQVQDAKKEAPGRIHDAVNEWVDKQAWGLGALVPDGLVDEVADLITGAALDALDECLETIATLQEANEMLGSPDRLRAMAESLGDVASASENLQIHKDDLDGWLSWDDGAPSKMYDAAIDSQVTALAHIAPKISGVAGVLKTHADDIESYYLDLAGVVGGAVVAIIGVVGAVLSLVVGALTSETGIGAVLGIIGAALGLVTAVAGVGLAGISAIQLFLASTQGTAGKLDDLLTSMPEWKKPRFAIVQ